jgi:phosphonopyruvate decarboxylase
MDGNEVLQLLAQVRSDEIVVTTMSTAKEWPRFSQSPLDVPLIGCMGKASSLGLGIALAQPARRVWVLDGDGSLLNNLGTLATLAGLGPPNLLHLVFEGGTYDTTGGQPIPATGVVDFAGLGLEAGYRGAYEFDDIDAFREALPSLMHEEGPVLINLKVAAGWSKTAFPKRGTSQALRELAQALGVPFGG